MKRPLRRPPEEAEGIQQARTLREEREAQTDAAILRLLAEEVPVREISRRLRVTPRRIRALAAATKEPGA